MFKVLRILILIFVFFVSVKAHAQSNFYFPAGMVSDVSHRWYAGHLKNFDEQPLWNRAQQLNGLYYRYLFLSVLADPLCVTIHIGDDNTADVYIKEMQRPENNEIDYKRNEVKVTLNQQQVKEFLLKLDEENFWRESSRTASVRFGGIQWVIENIKDHKYYLYQRWAAAEREYPAEIQYILDLANYTFPVSQKK